MKKQMILFGLVFFSIEVRFLSRKAYARRGWEPWGLFTGTYGGGRFFVTGPLMIEFLPYKHLVHPYIRVF